MLTLFGLGSLVGLCVIFVAVLSWCVESYISNKEGDANCTHCEKEECETAYAYDSENPLRNFCLIEFGADEMGWAVLNFNLNKDFGVNNNKHTEITLDLYAGATDCNLDSGMIVGELILSYKPMNDKHILTMTYVVDEPYYFTQVNGYAGYALLPFNDAGVHTTIPKDFPRSYSNEDGLGSYSFVFVIEDPNENFNIIGHSVVRRNSKPLYGNSQQQKHEF